MDIELYLEENYSYLPSKFEVKIPVYDEITGILDAMSTNYLEATMYVAENNKMTVDIESSGSGIIDIDSYFYLRDRSDINGILYLTAMGDNDLNSTLFLKSPEYDTIEGFFNTNTVSYLEGFFYASENNNMKVNTSVLYENESCIDATLYVRGIVYNDLKSFFKIYNSNKNDLDSYFTIMQEGDLSLHGFLDTRSAVDLSGHLLVNPYNRMSVVFDVEAPKKTTVKIPPIEDSSVRGNDKYKFINLGKEATLLVSTAPNDYSETFIKFEESVFKKKDHIEVERMLLKIYYIGEKPNVNYLAVQRASGEWSETSITYANRPKGKNERYSFVEINEQEKYVTFDVTDYMEHVDGNSNDGFVIYYNSPNRKTVSFSSREGSNSPELIVTSTDYKPVVSRTSDIPATVYIRADEKSELDGYFNVLSSYGESELECTFFLRQIDEPVEIDMRATLNVSVPELSSYLRTLVADTSDLKGYLVGRASDNIFLDGYVEASQPNLFAHLDIAFKEYLHGHFNVRPLEHSDVEGTMIVSTPFLHSTMYVRHYSDLKGFFSIYGDKSESLISYLDVSNPNLHSTLFSRKSDDSDLHGHLYLDEKKKSDLDSFLELSYPNLNSTALFRHSEDSDIKGTFIVREFKDMSATLDISSPEIHGSFNVLGNSIIESYLEISIPEVVGGALFRSYDYSDLQGFIYPRIVGVSDIVGTFRGRNKAMTTGYYYII